MKNSEGSRHIAAICAFSAALCLCAMCFQVNGHNSYAIAEKHREDSAIYASAEISDSLTIKEKIEQESSLWGRLARALWDIFEPWSP